MSEATKKIKETLEKGLETIEMTELDDDQLEDVAGGLEESLIDINFSKCKCQD
ncbi:MAG: hypothetical protein AAGE94_10745 [Acidobacteriota bacterium]